MTRVSRSARHRHSYDEHLAYERDSGMKHAYDGGEIIAKTPRPPAAHAAVSGILLA
jgi:hypothetical protein